MVYYCLQYYQILISSYNHEKNSLSFDEFGHHPPTTWWLDRLTIPPTPPHDQSALVLSSPAMMQLWCYIAP